MSARTPGMIPRSAKIGASLKSIRVSECKMTPEMYSGKEELDQSRRIGYRIRLTCGKALVETFSPSLSPLPFLVLRPLLRLTLTFCVQGRLESGFNAFWRLVCGIYATATRPHKGVGDCNELPRNLRVMMGVQESVRSGIFRRLDYTIGG